MKTTIILLKILILICFLFIACLFGYLYGREKTEIKHIKNSSESVVHTYNRIMLVNCLEKVKELEK